jgi:hypothetical protein
MDREIYNLECAHMDALEAWAFAWGERLLSCEPIDSADRAALADAARNIYETSGLPAPGQLLFAASPLAAEVSARMAAGLRQLDCWGWRCLDARTWEEGARCGTPGPEDIPVHPRAAAFADAVNLLTREGAAGALPPVQYPAVRRTVLRAVELASRVVAGAVEEEAEWDPPQADARDFSLVPPQPGGEPGGARRIPGAETALALVAAASQADSTASRLRAAGERQAGQAVERATHSRTLFMVREALEGHPGFAGAHGVMVAARAGRDRVLAAVGRRLDARDDLPPVARCLLRCVAWADDRGGGRDALWRPLPRWISFFEHVVGLRRLAHRLVWRHHETAEQRGRLLIARHGFAVATDRPERVALDWFARLHSEAGPSLRWRDGWELHHSSGVRVPGWLGGPRGADLDPRWYPALRGAEVQREFVRKVGMERMCAALGVTTLDRRGGYELLAVNLGRPTGAWPYLRMVNPSTGDMHLEPVARECASVEQALNFRNGGPFRHLAPLT